MPEECNEFVKNISRVLEVYDGEYQRCILRFDKGIW